MFQTPSVALLLGVSLAIAASPAWSGDAARGEHIFVKCQRCHSLDPNDAQENGPNLHGLFGRKAGTVENYKGYSEALKSSGLVWNEQTLDELLQNPKEFIKGTNMRLRPIKKEEDRQDLIIYLRDATK
jgi:cytochrome c